MLPDFPNLKEAFNRAVTRVTLERIKLYQGDLGKIRRGQISEGSSLAIVREDGNEEPLALTRASSALTISLDELKDFGLQQLFERLDQIALDMARQQSTREDRGLRRSCISGRWKRCGLPSIATVLQKSRSFIAARVQRQRSEACLNRSSVPPS
jgi:hypothetical protein